MSTENTIRLTSDRERDLRAAVIRQITSESRWEETFDQLLDYLRHEIWDLPLSAILDVECLGDGVSPHYLFQDKPKVTGVLKKNTRGMFFYDQRFLWLEENRLSNRCQIWGVCSEGWVVTTVTYSEAPDSDRDLTVSKAVEITSRVVTSTELLNCVCLRPLEMVREILGEFQRCTEVRQKQLAAARTRSQFLLERVGDFETQCGSRSNWMTTAQ